MLESLATWDQLLILEETVSTYALRFLSILGFSNLTTPIKIAGPQAFWNLFSIQMNQPTAVLGVLLFVLSTDWESWGLADPLVITRVLQHKAFDDSSLVRVLARRALGRFELLDGVVDVTPMSEWLTRTVMPTTVGRNALPLEVAVTLDLVHKYVVASDSNFKLAALNFSSAFTSHPLPFVRVLPAVLSAALVFLDQLEQVDREEAVRQFSTVVFANTNDLRMAATMLDVVAVGGRTVEFSACELADSTYTPLFLVTECARRHFIDRKTEFTNSQFTPLALFTLRAYNQWSSWATDAVLAFFNHGTSLPEFWSRMSVPSDIDDATRSLQRHLSWCVTAVARIDTRRSMPGALEEASPSRVRELSLPFGALIQRSSNAYARAAATRLMVGALFSAHTCVTTEVRQQHVLDIENAVGESELGEKRFPALYLRWMPRVVEMDTGDARLNVFALMTLIFTVSQEHEALSLDALNWMH